MTTRIEERIRRPAPAPPGPSERSEPTRPNVKRPESNELLRRMKRVDPEAARKYRQRSGQ